MRMEIITKERIIHALAGNLLVKLETWRSFTQKGNIVMGDESGMNASPAYFSFVL